MDSCFRNFFIEDSPTGEWYTIGDGFDRNESFNRIQRHLKPGFPSSCLQKVDVEKAVSMAQILGFHFDFSNGRKIRIVHFGNWAKNEV